MQSSIDRQWRQEDSGLWKLCEDVVTARQYSPAPLNNMYNLLLALLTQLSQHMFRSLLITAPCILLYAISFAAL